MSSVAINSNNRVHPHKFAMWLAIAGMIMLFAALTSAYIIRKSAGNWVEFNLPGVFWINTFVVLLSSVTMFLSVRAHKKYNNSLYRALISTTALLGIAFLVGQYIGWKQLNAGGILLSGNPSGSFVYVISGLHAVHMLGGVIALLVAAVASWIKPFNPKKITGLEVISIYWHFVDVLWIYLFIFFQINIV